MTAPVVPAYVSTTATRLPDSARIRERGLETTGDPWASERNTNSMGAVTRESAGRWMNAPSSNRQVLSAVKAWSCSPNGCEKNGSRPAPPLARTEARFVTVTPSGTSVIDDSSGAKKPLMKTSRMLVASMVNASTVDDETRRPALASARSNGTSNSGPSRVYFQSSSLSVGNPRIVAHSADRWRDCVSQAGPGPLGGNPRRESSSATVAVDAVLAVGVTVVTALLPPMLTGLTSPLARDRRSRALRCRARAPGHPTP